MKSFVVRGVPAAMQRDGWWLAAPPRVQRPEIRQTDRPWLRPLLLVALIALGDILLWDVQAGLSLAVFAVALVLAALSLVRPGMPARRLVLIAMLTLLAVLPVIELVQPLSVLILAAGLSLALTLVAGVPYGGLCRGAVRFWGVGFGQVARDVAGGAKKLRTPGRAVGQGRTLLAGWALPAGFGMLFLILFAQANPLLSGLINGVVPNSVTVPDLSRFAFWGLLALTGWPCLILWRLKEQLRADTRLSLQMPAFAVVNGRAVLRSLLLFNVMFAAQTVSDVAVLAGGALPDGISLAAYAHRGAYPLLATALLAGVFTLIAKPFCAQNPLVRSLLLIWIVQTLALVLGSVVRLDTYVDVYGLTRLRLAAFVWMGLVAAGLCVTWVQVRDDRSVSWMLSRVGALGACVVYLCALISFDRIIATHNLTHHVQIDTAYLCQLGEAATPAITRHSGLTRAAFCPGMSARNTRIFYPDDVREWGFRNWRVRRSLASVIGEGPRQ